MVVPCVHLVQKILTDMLIMLWNIIKMTPHFRVICEVANCSFTTTSWTRFKCHMSRKHQIAQNDDGIGNPDQRVQMDHNDEDYENEGLPPNTSDYQLSSYLLKLEVKHKLSDTGIATVVENTESIVHRELNVVRKGMEEILRKEGIDSEIISSIDFSPSLNQFNTKYKREMFYKTQCGMVSPQEVILGSSFVRKRSRLTQVFDKGYYIPFKKTIQSMLNLPEFVEEINSTHESADEIMSDICDASYVQTHPVHSRNKNALQIVLNTDELELTNPLGTHTKKHKIVMFYAMFANIQPAFRSQLSTIQLVAIAKSAHVKKHGANLLLHDFIETIIWGAISCKGSMDWNSGQSGSCASRHSCCTMAGWLQGGCIFCYTSLQTLQHSIQWHEKAYKHKIIANEDNGGTHTKMWCPWRPKPNKNSKEILEQDLGNKQQVTLITNQTLWPHKVPCARSNALIARKHCALRDGIVPKQCHLHQKFNFTDMAQQQNCILSIQLFRGEGKTSALTKIPSAYWC